MFTTRLLSLLLTASIIISSCSKKDTANPVDPPPPPTQPERDGSYLLRSALQYGQDDKGTKFSDTTRTTVQWDTKNRMTFYAKSYNNGIYIDSFRLTYTDRQSIQREWFYQLGQNADDYTNVIFYNANGRIDSMITSAVGEKSIGLTYYAYNASGNDTLETSYLVSNNVKTLYSKRRMSYVDNWMSTDDRVLANGLPFYAATYTNGNKIKETNWNIGTSQVASTQEYTYNNVLAGGFYFYKGAQNLIASEHTIDIYPSDYTINKTYTYDDKNRVKTMKEFDPKYPTSWNITEFTYY